jgi:carbon storage regulator CsrA
MLVLTRKRNEQIVITLGTQVFVRVVEVCRDRVRLGIIAPKNVLIHPDEVARRLAAAVKEPERMLAGEAS